MCVWCVNDLPWTVVPKILRPEIFVTSSPLFSSTKMVRDDTRWNLTVYRLVYRCKWWVGRSVGGLDWIGAEWLNKTFEPTNGEKEKPRCV